MATRLKYLLSGCSQVKIPGLVSTRIIGRPYSNIDRGETKQEACGRDAWGSIGLPRRQEAWRRNFMLSTIPLDVGPDGLLGMEQSNQTDKFSVKDSSRTLILSG